MINSVLNVKALVGAFNQEKALVGAFSVIVQLVVEPMENYTALVLGVELLLLEPALAVLHVVQRLGRVAQIEQILDGDVVDGEVLDGRVHGVSVRPRDDLDTVSIVQKLTKSSGVNHLVAEVMMSSLCRQCFVRERQNAIAILWCLVWYLTLIL